MKSWRNCYKVVPVWIVVAENGNEIICWNEEEVLKSTAKNNQILSEWNIIDSEGNPVSPFGTIPTKKEAKKVAEKMFYDRKKQKSANHR